MENLNDLIWTDEDADTNSEISTQGIEMTRVCMIAFCGGGIGVGGDIAGNFYGCIQDAPYRMSPCT